MLFVIDIGNTETVLGLFTDEDLTGHWRLASSIHRTADEYWILIKTWSENEGYSLNDLEGVVISSVVPTLTELFSQIARIRLGIEPLLINADIDTGLRNAVAGYDQFGGPLIIVDFGTATTFDVISEKGEYLGGIISLGVKGASHELHRIAAKLPRVQLVFPSRVVGTRTETSIQSGIMWGTASLVDGMIGKIKQEMNWTDVHVVATGGVANTVVEKCINIEKVEPFLTLYGMRLIYNRLSRQDK